MYLTTDIYHGIIDRLKVTAWSYRSVEFDKELKIDFQVLFAGVKFIFDFSWFLVSYTPLC